MSSECQSSIVETFSADMQRLLRTASQQPWGPGREIDATVHHLHQELLEVESRLGSTEQNPEDVKLVHKIDHDLRNKLMIFQYYEAARHEPAKPRGRLSPPPRRRRD